MKKLFFLVLMGIGWAMAQEKFQEVIPPTHLKTIQIFNPQTNDLTPIIEMGERLIFTFDDTQRGFTSYLYKIERYNRNWEKSELFLSDYLTNYESAVIRDYQNSFNTLMPYTHYEVEIPNRDVGFKLSGNYAISVYKRGEDKPLIRKRFCIVDPMVNIGMNVERNPAIDGYNQRVAVQVNSNGIDLTQNMDFNHLVIFKNNNWQESLSPESPVFSNPNALTYNQISNNFQGGNEYHFFDTKNLQVSTLTTERTIRDSIYQTILYPNSTRANDIYIEMPDVNGNYYVRNILVPDQTLARTEADYSNVFFALENIDLDILPDEEICVVGAFNDFSCTPESTLNYYEDSNMYETHILLKQGYYNYQFAVKRADGSMDFNRIPGSYWQTENMYQSLFYYRPWGQRYDLLVGYGEAYSRPSQR